MRDKALSGDVLLVEGRGLVSRLIRALTGQNISHVAMLLWIGETLWVAEMKEFTGYRLRPASLWVADAMQSSVIYYGFAPAEVKAEQVKDSAFKFRNEKYSYLSLLKVWLAQLLRKKTNAGLVCSTFVQRCWEACGVEFKQTADPGDYMRLCTYTTALREG
jgi:hypothetical protein